MVDSGEQAHDDEQKDVAGEHEVPQPQHRVCRDAVSLGDMHDSYPDLKADGAHWGGELCSRVTGGIANGTVGSMSCRAARSATLAATMAGVGQAQVLPIEFAAGFADAVPVLERDCHRDFAEPADGVGQIVRQAGSGRAVHETRWPFHATSFSSATGRLRPGS